VLKLAPVVRAVQTAGGRLTVKVCLSGQHGALARDIAREIGLDLDFDLGEPGEGRPIGLSEGLARLLERLSALLLQVKPAGILVQGDTTTTLAGSLAAFHHGIPSFHVEAGLRTSNALRPFPEEMNRRLVSRLSALHFAATAHARDNLLAEGILATSIVVTGNTVVDALAAYGARDGEGRAADVHDGKGAIPQQVGEGHFRDDGGARVLVTLHRREGAAGAASIARAVAELAARGADVVWIRHPNPTSESALAALGEGSTVRVLPPQPYAAFVGLMRRARVILTDSGGVQEEAPVLGVPVVVLRRETDRPEAVISGNAVVVGDDATAILEAVRRLVDDEQEYGRRKTAGSPFGDGGASGRIVAALEGYFR
jgi:UDP-N-acetylglucosamine 2-epimerase